VDRRARRGQGCRARDTTGNVPDSLDMNGLDFNADKFTAATAVDSSQWSQEMKLHAELIEGRLGEGVPASVKKRYEELKKEFA
jgi:Phosphoenolpyruvate carboxykinase (GTP)